NVHVSINRINAHSFNEYEFLSSTLTLVVNRPQHFPCFPTVERPLPTPIEFVPADVLEDHPLLNLRSIGPDGFTREHHLPIFKFTDEIEITAFIVNPGLLPPASPSIEYRDAAAAKMHELAAREVLFDDAAVENSLDAVCAMPGIIRAAPRPSELPVASPESHFASSHAPNQV